MQIMYLNLYDDYAVSYAKHPWKDMELKRVYDEVGEQLKVLLGIKDFSEYDDARAECKPGWMPVDPLSPIEKQLALIVEKLKAAKVAAWKRQQGKLEEVVAQGKNEQKLLGLEE